MIYVSRPEKVEAAQWTGENVGEVLALSHLIGYSHTSGNLYIGLDKVPVDNYVVLGRRGIPYSLPPEDFHKRFRKPGVAYRDSKTGRFINKTKATENPDTATAETA